ncbi:hypothetical protein N9O43_01680 [Burkholderiales bacterium]|nr:hypothetical protein [Burkholderiales bacterium]
MTQSVLGCSICDLDIIPSEVERQGPRTKWFAKCEGKFLVHFECRKTLLSL